MTRQRSQEFSSCIAQAQISSLSEKTIGRVVWCVGDLWGVHLGKGIAAVVRLSHSFFSSIFIFVSERFNGFQPLGHKFHICHSCSRWWGLYISNHSTIRVPLFLLLWGVPALFLNTGTPILAYTFVFSFFFLSSFLHCTDNDWRSVSKWMCMTTSMSKRVLWTIGHPVWLVLCTTMLSFIPCIKSNMYNFQFVLHQNVWILNSCVETLHIREMHIVNSSV